MSEMSLLAPAKINLSLHVQGKRDDGYHELAMLMVPLAYGDLVHLRLKDTPGVTLSCPGVDLNPGEENIAVRAAHAVLKQAERSVGVDITIDKRIPVAAGLGGGSSDAAAVLNGLDALLKLGLSVEQKRQIALQLGADVPFFVRSKTAWATGVGERLEEVSSLPPAWYLLVNPGFPVSTAWVFGNLGLTTPRTTTKMPRFSGLVDEITSLMHNDLEAVTASRYPEIDGLKQRLLELGARGALMSGSGPTVFGVFDREASARQAASVLEAVPGYRVIVTTALEHSSNGSNTF